MSWDFFGNPGGHHHPYNNYQRGNYFHSTPRRSSSGGNGTLSFILGAIARGINSSRNHRHNIHSRFTPNAAAAKRALLSISAKGVDGSLHHGRRAAGNLRKGRRGRGRRGKRAGSVSGGVSGRQSAVRVRAAKDVGGVGKPTPTAQFFSGLGDKAHKRQRKVASGAKKSKKRSRGTKK